MGAFQRWFRRSFVGLTTGSMLAVLVPPLPAVAAAHSDADLFAEQIATTLAGALDGLAALEDLQVDLPMTMTAPADLLGAGPFSAALGALPTGAGTYSDSADLAAALDALAGLTASPDPAGSILGVDLTLDLSVPDIDVPLAFDGVDFDLVGGAIPVELGLTMSDLQLQYDPDALSADEAFAIIGTPTIDLTVLDDATDAASAIDPLSTIVGLADVDVSGLADLDIDFDATLVDFDGDNLITQAELATALPEDLLSLAPVSTTALLDLDLDYGGVLDTLVGGTELPHADLVTNLSDYLTETVDPDPVLDQLEPFLNLSADELLGGLGQLASSLQKAEGLAPSLPFLDTYIGEATTAVDDLLSFVREQGVAVVLCGDVDRSPPIGPLIVGETGYCRAYTTENPTDVSWTVNGTEVSTDTDTVGTAPSASASFTVPADANISVEFTLADGTTNVARPRFTTLDDLRQLLIDRLGASDGGGGAPALVYDAATQSLEVQFGFGSTSDDLPTAPDDLDIGSQLDATTTGAAAGDPTTQLEGMAATSGASLDASIGSVDVGVGFGVLLVDDAAKIDPDDNDTDPVGLEDRFYIRELASGDLLRYDDLSVTATVELRGRIGFIEVTASGVDDDGSGAALDIGPADDTAPIFTAGLNGGDLEVDVDGNGTIDTAETLTDVLQLRDVLAKPASETLDLSCNLAAHLGLEASVSGQVEVAGAGATATVVADWPDVFGDDCSPDHDGLTTTIDTDFYTEVDFNPDNPLALLSNVLDSIETVASSFGADARLQDRIPVVGLSVRDLFGRIVELQALLDEIRTGTPNTSVICGDVAPESSGRPPQGDATGVDGTLYCQAKTASPISGGATNVQWTVEGAGTSVLGGATDPGTITTGSAEGASSSATFDVAGDLGDDFLIFVTFEDDNGTPHVGGAPSLAIVQSLQDVETALEKKLGLEPNELRFALEDAGDGDSALELVINLGIGECTSGFADDCPDSARIVADADRPTADLSFDLSSSGAGLPDLVGLEGSGSLPVDYQATAQLDLAVDLALDPTVHVFGTTGLAAAVSATSQDISFRASLGPVDAAVGAGNSITSGTAQDDDDENDFSGQDDLTDTSADFEADNVTVGSILTKGTDTCIIDAVTTTTLSCEVDGALSWDEGDSYEVTSAGVVEAALSATLDDPGLADDDVKTADNYLAALAFNIGDQTGVSADCGEANGLNLDGADACARLGLVIEDDFVGDLGFRFDAPTTVDASAPSGLDLADLLLDFDTLLGILEALFGDVETLLVEGAAGIDAPIIGDALAAGADVAGAFSTALGAFSDLMDAAGIAPDTATDTAAIAIDSHITTALGDAGVLRDTGSSGDADDVVVELTCDDGGSEVDCHDDDTFVASDIVDARITFTLGQEACDPDCSVPFDLGLPGLPLRLEGALGAEAEWGVLVDLGISKADGPYLVVDGAGHGSDPELSLSASLGLGAGTGCPSLDFPPGLDTGYAEDECLQGELGFLDVTVNDHTGDVEPDGGTGVGVETALQIEAGSDDTITLGELGSIGLTPSVVANANVNLRFRTGLNVPNATQFPALVGAFEMGGSFDSTASDPWSGFEPSFSGLQLDGGGFVREMLAPIAGEIQRFTGPLQPVIDTLQAPLPVLSELASLVGADPIVLLDLMKAQADADTAFDLIESIFALVTFINTDLADIGWIELMDSDGSFTIDVAKAQESPLTADRAGEIIDTVTGAVGSVIGEISDDLGGFAPPDPGSADDRGETFGVPGLTFPVLEDAGNVFALLMGQDATLVRFDAGPLQATAGFSYSFGPIMVGPIPITVTLGGSGTVRGRFVVGYDTYGLRQVIDGGSGTALFDGIFFDDLNRAGEDVPEIVLIGTVYADAGVDLVIVSAGVRGGLEMTTELDLDDRPDPDGKLRIEEIVNKLANPICLFRVSGRLEAFLQLFVEIDLLLTSKEYVFELARVVLLEFSGACDPPSPEPAHGFVDDGDRVLELNVGNSTRRNARNINIGETAETVTVRQVDEAGTRIEVSMFGATKVYDTKVELGDSHAGEPWDLVLADAESPSADPEDDNDVISVEAGGDLTAQGSTQPESEGDAVEVYPFTVKVNLSGGHGDDRLTGGTKNDILDGGPGGDQLSGSDGRDTLYGRGGEDVLEGGLGDDFLLDGGTENDRITGGPGTDTLIGDDGDDVLDGGPALREAELDELDLPAADKNKLRDGGDTLVGGDGGDTLNGGVGDDRMFGDTEVLTSDVQATINALGSGAALPAAARTACDETASASGVDVLTGGEGDDLLFGGDDDDLLFGEGGNDLLCGGADDDTLEGDAEDGPDGDDVMLGGGGEDTLDGRGGDDRGAGDAGDDTVLGGPGRDLLAGGTDADRVDGGAGNDLAVGDTGIDPAELAAGAISATVTPLSGTDGGPRADCGAGIVGGGNGDCVLGGAGADRLYGEAGQDDVRGDDGEDEVFGGDDDDTVRGGRDDDDAYGGSGDDDVYGDSGDDYLEGNADADTMYGGPGNDDMIGGSRSAGQPDAGDRMSGGADHDVMAGDNARIVRPGGTDPAFGDGPARTVTLYDSDVDPTVDDSVAGDDIIDGNAGDDRMYGQGNDHNEDQDGDGKINEDWPDGIDQDVDGLEGEDPDGDVLRGGSGDDLLEGNQGDDRLTGGLGFDDLIGGSSTAGVSDGNDVIVGDTGRALGGTDDVIAGDNATIDKTVSGGAVVQDPARGGPARLVVLLDVALAGGGASVAAGDDVIDAEGGEDRVYGGGGADTIDGGADDDVIEGNDGPDTIDGGNGNDDIIGGSSAADGNIGTTSDGTGAADVGDTLLEGGNGVDVIAGDNARINRPTDGDSLWVPDVNRDGAAIRDIQLFDTATASQPTAADGAGGGDAIVGDDAAGDTSGDGPDLAFGQTGADTIDGQGGDDYIEGNDGPDILSGGPQHDDLIGGSSANDGAIAPSSDGTATLDATDADWADGTGDRDVLHGNDGHDVLAGDNARITRPTVEATGEFQADPNRGGTAARDVLLFDVAAAGAPAPATDAAGPDLLSGDDGKDRLYAQGSGDDVAGGPGDDIAEGNAGADLIDGGDGDDDLTGGSSSAADVIGDGTFEGPIGDDSSGHNAHDTGDTITGGGGHDVIAGDNARITRPLGPLWIPDDARGSIVRDVQLFDVQIIEGPDVPTVVSGGDLLLGQAGHDRVFGQGNGAEIDEDGDLEADFDPDEHSHGGVNEDPLDGVDNDRDGFTDEDGALVGVGATTWDGTAVVLDLTVPGAGDADAIFGGDGSDVLEGNHGADLVVGNAGQDDVVGGSSAGDGHILPGDHDDHVAPTDLADGHDALHGDAIGEVDTGDADVLVGDNGVIDRGDVGAAWQTLGQRDDPDDTLDSSNPFLDVIVRNTTIADTPEAGGAYGSDWMAGGGGPDELVGQLGDDEQHGDWGDDALIGDLGKVDTVLSITEAERIFVQQPFLEAFLEPQGALVHNVELFTFLEGAGGEGRDLMLGEDGTDSLHGGPGNDVMNGDGDGTLADGDLPSAVVDPNPGPDEDDDPNLDDGDYLFGGDGDDDMWGGRGPDDLFGGYGDDEMDVFPRDFTVSYKGGPDETIWLEVAAADIFQGLDYIYGGWDQDAMQADLQETGPRIADRLIDWSGAYNVYYVCEGAYGEGSITRTVAPQVIDFLQDLAEGRGAFDVTSKTSSGFREAAIVFTQDIKHNTNPVHPDHPGHFTCDGVE